MRPIIIVKRRRGDGGGHHGGAWKVAYADFVTAMMAFFLVLWLVASVTKEQRAAMFEYFKNPSMEEGKSVKPAKGVNGPGGASTSVINLGGGLDAPKSAIRKETGMAAKRLAAEAEHKRLESLMEELRQAIDKSQALRPFKDQLLLDITPEGLRIQIVDAQNRPMFDLGSSPLKDYTSGILKALSGYLKSVPNRISLSGHTDTTPYVARIVGLSSVVLVDKYNPRNPINQRISIIVMTKQAEESALRTDTKDAGQIDSAPPDAAPAAPASPPAAAVGATAPAPG
jgi:chemotaxis protein MotB